MRETLNSSRQEACQLRGWGSLIAAQATSSVVGCSQFLPNVKCVCVCVCICLQVLVVVIVVAAAIVPINSK